MSYVAEISGSKKSLMKKIAEKLGKTEVENSVRDYYAKRPPRPCGITIHLSIRCKYIRRYCCIYDMGLKTEVKPCPLSGLQLV